MNTEIMPQAGFGDEVDMVGAGRCPFCKTAIAAEDFRDTLSAKEFRISGLCQSCQDDMFSGGGDV